jgi:hypothetical protein
VWLAPKGTPFVAPEQQRAADEYEAQEEKESDEAEADSERGDDAAAADSWRRVLAFFADHVMNSPTKPESQPDRPSGAV